jgi:hypothetical protein
MTNEQAWLYAASWGSYMTSGDPGGCMYGFSENFTVQSEQHRAACLEWIDNHCKPNVESCPEDYEEDELDQMAEFRIKLLAAPVSNPKGTGTDDKAS